MFSQSPEALDKTVNTVYVRPRLHLGPLQHALTDHVHDAGKISTTAKHAAVVPDTGVNSTLS